MFQLPSGIILSVMQLSSFMAEIKNDSLTAHGKQCVFRMKSGGVGMSSATWPLMSVCRKNGRGQTTKAPIQSETCLSWHYSGAIVHASFDRDLLSMEWNGTAWVLILSDRVMFKHVKMRRELMGNTDSRSLGNSPTLTWSITRGLLFFLLCIQVLIGCLLGLCSYSRG